MNLEEQFPEIPDSLKRHAEAKLSPPSEPEEAEDYDPLEDDDPVEFEGLRYQKVWYLNGVFPRDVQTRLPRYEWRNPPNLGYSEAFVIEAKQGRSKTPRVTVFCPYTFTSEVVTVEAGEIVNFEPEALTKGRARELTKLLHATWSKCCHHGWSRDYDTAALILQRMGETVPTETPRIREDRPEKVEKVGGKPPADTLLVAVNPSGKMGQVGAFFLGKARSVRECMAEFGMTRSSVLTHLNRLNKVHGLGYRLVGDTAEVQLPPDCKDPFGEAGTRRARTSTGSASGKAPDPKSIIPVKSKTKRGRIALALNGAFKSLEEVAEEVGCSTASVLSHLHDLHTKHGLGYEITADRTEAKVLAPEGQELEVI